ncbi:MAG TPA: hypothetical protein VGF61_12320 [Candidatus Acidoferrum sp.]
MRSPAAGAGILDDDDIVAVGSKLFRALYQVQNKIVADRELPFLELLQTVIYRVCITVNEKDAESAASVGGRALQTNTSLIRLGSSQV